MTTDNFTSAGRVRGAATVRADSQIAGSRDAMASTRDDDLVVMMVSSLSAADDTARGLALNAVGRWLRDPAQPPAQGIHACGWARWISLGLHTHGAAHHQLHFEIGPRHARWFPD